MAQDLVAFLHETSERYGSKIALLVKLGIRYRTWTYEDMWAESGRVASLLQAKGVKPSDRVAIWGPNSPQWGIRVLRQHARWRDPGPHRPAQRRAVRRPHRREDAVIGLQGLASADGEDGLPGIQRLPGVDGATGSAGPAGRRWCARPSGAPRFAWHPGTAGGSGRRRRARPTGAARPSRSAGASGSARFCG